jgi:hypothetical protein
MPMIFAAHGAAMLDRSDRGNRDAEPLLA